MAMVIGVIIMFAAVFGLDFVIHGTLLGDTYKATADVWRTEAEMKSLMKCMMGGQFLFAAAFLILFSKFVKSGESRILQGLVYGVWVGIMFGASNIIWFVVLPIPAVLGYLWAGLALIQCAILGLIAGAITRQP